MQKQDRSELSFLMNTQPYEYRPIVYDSVIKYCFGLLRAEARCKGEKAAFKYGMSCETTVVCWVLL